MTPEQVQGLQICLILSLSMAVICPMLCLTIRDRAA